ncbi:ribosome biogenesis GTPase YlqF [Alkalibacter rhizosphaerae]|uniref:Ribosome biogenesis GTPase A n=1 Tax=Alkalibacter rhizosphaerae TaxID=2815577 RepID=A0A974XMP0_9FIRM|nr:ribosome biogenesis GTPase YlqF [Alkalibacter rhizosphaerae]QSX08716.1 ribosome biogenesis GTPase YlqF [Alkalibacter rhizosphaerae]
MDIQWYPGHMAKAKREIRESLKLIDLAVELVDARVPVSSTNPEVDQLLGSKKKIVVLNKADLADPAVNKLWEAHYKKMGQPYVFVNSLAGKGIKDLVAAIKKVMEPKLERDRKKGRMNRQIRCLVLGIPNVGKSTLINAISGKATAKTGNKPGVTKANQWIKVGKDVLLLDTPGILWPKFEDDAIGLKLAWIGSIKDTIYDREEAALRLIGFLRQNYLEELKDRYGVSPQKESTDLEVMETIARKRMLLSKGGEVDYARTSAMLMDEMKKNIFANVSFEKPEDFTWE